MARKVASSLTLDEATTIVETVITKARELKYNPLVVVVIDSGGHLVAMVREDGNGPLRFGIAHGKASAAVGMGIPSRYFESGGLAQRPQFVNALNGVAGGKFIPVPGGVLIIRDNEIVGAVGVSGDTSDNDEHVAILGIRAAGLKSSPSSSVPEKTEKSNL